MSLFDGSPNILEVYWTKNRERIDSQKSGGRLSEPSFEDPSLTIKDVCHKDVGKYQLRAVNAVGENISEIIDLGILLKMFGFFFFNFFYLPRITS